MKLNVFSIPSDKVQNLKEKLLEVKMTPVKTSNVDGWDTTFYFSDNPEPVKIPWVVNFPDIFSVQPLPTNNIYFGCYLWEKESTCYVISFGKCHFYLRQFADSDFGLQMATRIANKDDVGQKAARKFAGKKKREVRSYTKETPIDIESGESVDFIQGAVLSEYETIFGKVAKFGTSILLTVDIQPAQISNVLQSLFQVSQEAPKFNLPKIEIIKDEDKINYYDSKLIQQIKSIDASASFGDESHYIVGIDFIFPSNQKYALKLGRIETSELDHIDLSILKDFITTNSISDDEILDIRLKIIPDDARPYSKSLKQSLDYLLDDERVMLADGEWKQFNEDYLTQLHEYIDSVIDIDENVEDALKEINITEPEFNEQSQNYGYTPADRDFSILGLPGHTVEAWDLKKDKVVYAVKFGTPQKLGYVCDQAINTLEIMRNNPKYLTLLSFETYCLWIGIDRVNIPEKISEISSIIFKQKLENWARKCRELGITPKLKISKKVEVSLNTKNGVPQGQTALH